VSTSSDLRFSNTNGKDNSNRNNKDSLRFSSQGNNLPRESSNRKDRNKDLRFRSRDSSLMRDRNSRDNMSLKANPNEEKEKSRIEGRMTRGKLNVLC
jgi:hypothetical protein